MQFLKEKRASIILAVATFAILTLIGYAYITQEDTSVFTSRQELQAAYPDTSGQAPAQDSGTVEDPYPAQVRAPQADNNPYGIPGCRCHSKKPAMVKMHDTIGGQDCGMCHKPGENLMDPNRRPTTSADINERKSSEAICRNCHKNDKTVIADKSLKSKVKISGALFCPKCRKQVTIEDKTCGDCNGTLTKSASGWQCSACGVLVDVDKVAKMSKDKPTNDICKLCHFDSKQLASDHSQLDASNKSKVDAQGGLNNCLSCHKSHNQCGGCHF